MEVHLTHIYLPIIFLTVIATTVVGENQWNSTFNNNYYEQVQNLQEGQESVSNEENGSVEDLVTDNDILYSAACANVIRPYSDFPIVITLERSDGPVDFNVTLWDSYDYPNRRFIVATHQVTLNRLEQQMVTLKVEDIPFETSVMLVITVTGENGTEPEESFVKLRRIRIPRVFIQTDKSVYRPGETVNYRVVALDPPGRSLQSPKYLDLEFSQPRDIRSWNQFSAMNMTGKGFVHGSFVKSYSTDRITASVHTEPGPPSLRSLKGNAVSVNIESDVSQSQPNWASVGMKLLRPYAFFSKPKMGIEVSFTSAEGFPLEGTCDITIQPQASQFGSYKYLGSILPRRTVTLDKNTGKGIAEFDITKEFGLKLKDIKYEGEVIRMDAVCSQANSEKIHASTSFQFFQCLYTVELVNKGPSIYIQNENSSISTVVFKMQVGTRDNSPIVNPPTGLTVALLISDTTIQKNQMSQANFSLPIPEDGVVTLELEIEGTPEFTENDKIYMAVWDASRTEIISNFNNHYLRLSILNHAKPKEGDTLKIQIRSAHPYSHLNALLVSNNVIIKADYLSFNPIESDAGLNGTFEIKLPTNTHSPLMKLVVYGTIEYFDGLETHSRVVEASELFHVTPNNNTHELKLAAETQPQDDNSVIVSITVEGMPNSCVSVRAKKIPYGSPISLIKSQHRPTQKPFSFYRSSLFGDLGVASNADPEEFRLLTENPFEELSDDTHNSEFWDAITGPDGIGKVQKHFSRLQHSGTYVLTAIEIDEVTGLRFTSTEVSFDVPLPSIILQLGVPNSVVLGESVEIRALVQNNSPTAKEINATLSFVEGGVSHVGVEGKLFELNAESLKVLKFLVIPKSIGNFEINLSTDDGKVLPVKKSLAVLPPEASQIMFNNPAIKPVEYFKAPLPVESSPHQHYILVVD